MTVRSFLAFVGLCVLVSGCSAPSATHVLRVANWGGAGDDSEFSRTVHSLIREFESQNPGIEVQIEGTPGSQEYVSKMLLSFIAGSEPDIMTLDASSAAVFINNGVLKDLTPLMTSDSSFKKEDYFPNVLDIARRGDSYYAVPIDFTPMVMYYNKRLFDEAGVPYPRPGWSFDDFREKAKRLTQGKTYGFTFSNWMPGWLMWLWNQNGDVLDPTGKRAKGCFDSDESVRAVDFIKKVLLDDKSAPNLSQAASMGVDMFATGQAAMEVSGHWAMVGYGISKDLKLEDVGVVELPTNLGKSATVMYEAGYAIGKNCKKADLAWKFIKFMTSHDAELKLCHSGIAVSARKDVCAERAVDEHEKAFLAIIPSARAPWGSKVEGYDFVESTGQKMMDNVLKSGMPVDRALREACSAIDEELSRK